jgi:hypothetical protein
LIQVDERHRANLTFNSNFTPVRGMSRLSVRKPSRSSDPHGSSPPPKSAEGLRRPDSLMPSTSIIRVPDIAVEARKPAFWLSVIRYEL